MREVGSRSMKLFCIALVVAGAIIMLFGIIKYYRALVELKGLARKNRLFSNWLYFACMLMMLFFLLGYLAFAAVLIRDQSITSLQLLIALIFFFGAIFVLSMVTLVRRMFLAVLDTDELKKRLAQQELMSDIAQSFISAGPVGDLIQTALERMGRFMGFDGAVVAQYDPERGMLDAKYAWLSREPEAGTQRLRSASFIPGEAFYERFITGREPHWARGKADDPHLLPACGAEMGAMLCAPIFAAGTLWGILEIGRCGDAYDWEESDIYLCTLVASLFSGLAGREEMGKTLRTMSSIVENSPQYIAYVDGRGRFSYVNPAASAITGYSADEIKSGGIDLLCGPEVTHFLRETVIPALLKQGAYQYEIPMARKDGQVLTMEFSNFTIRDEHGTGMGAIASDITERKRLENDLLDAKKAAENANRAKSEFLARMSHEIRTPMNAIVGMATIARHSEDMAKIRQNLDKIDVASKHLLGLINEILDMSKIEADKLELVSEPFSLRGMLDGIRDVIAVRAAEKSIALTMQVGQDVPDYVTGDELRLTQVVMNLLSNAVKFTAEGGCISLSAEKLAEGDGQVRLRVSVRDEGIGMSEEQQEKLFLPFEQTGASISAKYGGTGLGLAISKRLVEMMGGEISVDSAPGRGSLFSFTVQFAVADGAAAESAAVEADTAQHTDFSGCRILVAEDLEINREVLAGLLEPTNVAIDMAADGAEAVAMFEKDPRRYNLIFMDLQMPVMDGYDATRAIRSSGLPRAGEIPIIAMTANAFAEDVKNSLDAGMDGHISKPLDADDVVRQMLHYIKPAN